MNQERPRDGHDEHPSIPRTETAHDEPLAVVRAAPEHHTPSLDRAITDILAVMRAELVMDIVFVSRQAGDDVVVSHAALDADPAGFQELRHPKADSFCQRVLDGRLPAVMPDVDALRATHDVPAAPVRPGAYMATPVWLQDGTLYGTLCCLGMAAAPDLGERHHQRLRMSARQIARLIDEAGVR